MKVDGEQADFDLFRDMKFFINIIILIAGFFSKTVEVFLRRDFGERYLRFETLVITFLILNIMTAFSSSQNMFTGAVSISGGLMLFSYAFLAVGFYHKVKIIKRNYKGETDTHSYFFGRQWGIWAKIFPADGFLNKMFPLFTHRYGEPALVFIIGAVMLGVDPAFGNFLMFSAVCLAISMGLYYRMELTRFLDANDARIAAENNSTVRFGDVNLRPTAKPVAGKSPTGKPTGEKWSEEKPIGMSEQAGQAEDLTIKTKPPEEKPASKKTKWT